MKVHVRAHVGDVTSSFEDSYISLELEDIVSGTHFMYIKLSYEQFGKLIGTNGSVNLEADILNVENLGKKFVVEPRSIVCTESFGHLPYSKQRPAQEQWLAEHGKEDGWIVKAYLGSRDSIQTDYKSGVETFNYHVFKYVDISEEERQELIKKRY